MTDSLETLRTDIDNIDEQIIQLISLRFDVVQKIGELKQGTGQAVQDPRREAQVYVRLNELSKEYNVPLEVVTHIYDYLMGASREAQK